MYCGKDLAPGEVCDCAASAAARAKKTGQTEKSENKQSGYTGWQESTYRTGYTKKTRKKFRDFFKKAPKFSGEGFKDAAGEVSGFTKRFMRDPVNTVTNPGVLSIWQIIIITVLTSLVLSLCTYFSYVRIFSSMLHQALGAVSGFAEIAAPSYRITALLEYTLVGTISYTVLIFLYFAVLFIVNRFIMRQQTSFKTFCVRPAAALIPLMVLSLVGVAVNFFSVYATVMLFLTGIVMWIILTYEGLRAEWSFAPAVRVMYMTALSFFIFFVIVFNILRII